MKFLYRQHNKENAKDVTILHHLASCPAASSARPALVESQNLFEMPNSGRTPALSCPSRRPARRTATDAKAATAGADRDRDRRDGGGGGGNGNKSGKKRKKGRSPEAQQPPQ